MSTRRLITSVLWAGAVSVPLSLWGNANCFGLVHSGSPLLLLFLPAYFVLLMLEQRCDEDIVLALALLAQFLFYFALVVVARRVFRRIFRRENGVQPSAAPNGGPAAPAGNSGATERPPSAS